MSKSNRGLSKRVAVGLLAGALTVFGIALAGPAAAVADPEVPREAGATRFGTAGAVCTEAYPDGTGTVVVASGRNFPDALAAAPLAAANDGCILLVEPDSVPEETQASLDELGADTAIIVGGTGAVSQDVEDALGDSVTVSRIAGDDRFETAAAVADEIDAADLEDGSTAILATGRNAPDALAAGPLAAAGPFPILLTEPGSLPASTEAALANYDNVIVVGGTAAVSDETADDAGTASGDADVTRLAGETREETAVAIAEFEVSELGWGPEEVELAAGRPPAEVGIFSPDALVAGPLGGLREAPVLLVESADSVGEATLGFLDDHSNTIEVVRLIGGTAVISDQAGEEAAGEEGAGGVENDEPSTPDIDAPQLTAVEFVNADATAQQILYRYVFDEEISASPIVSGGFHLYSQDMVRATAASAQRDADNTSAVLVLFSFGTPTLSPAVIEPQVATVERNIVQDADGMTNPQGAVHGVFAVANPNGTGNTRAPDLRTVTVISATQADFTFDSPVAAVVSAASLQLVTQAAGDVAPAVQPGTATAIQGTGFDAVTVRVTFASTANAVRGVTQRGAVAGVFGNTNPLETEPVAGTTGQTAAPDLVSVSFDEATNRVTYTFDENIESLGTAGSRTSFRIYFRDGSELRSLDAERTDSRTVVAQFNGTDPVNAITVGASAPAGSVCRAAPGDITRCNQDDEIGRSVTFAAGDDFGPELVGFRTGSTTDIFGTTNGRFVDFVFDTPVSIQTATGFFLYDEDGNARNMTCGAGLAVRSATGTTETAMTVRCSVATPAAPTADQAADAAALADAALAGVAYQAVQTRDARQVGASFPTAVPQTGTDVRYSNHEASAGEAPAAA